MAIICLLGRAIIEAAFRPLHWTKGTSCCPVLYAFFRFLSDESLALVAMARHSCPCAHVFFSLASFCARVFRTVRSETVSHAPERRTGRKAPSSSSISLPARWDSARAVRANASCPPKASLFSLADQPPPDVSAAARCTLVFAGYGGTHGCASTCVYLVAGSIRSLMFRVDAAVATYRNLGCINISRHT